MGKYEADRKDTARERSEVDKVYQAGQPQRTAQQIASRKKAIKNQRIVIIAACSVVLVLLIALIVGLIIRAAQPGDDGRILPNVYAGGIDLGGMTREEAVNALHLATDSTLSKKDMVVTLSNRSLALSPADTKAALDVQAVVDAAYQYGRTGSEEDYIQAKKAASSTSHTIALLPYMELELDWIRSATESFCSSYGSTLTQPSVTLEGTRPAYDPEYPELFVTHQTLTVTMGTPDYALSASKLYDLVLDAYSLNQLSVEYEAPTLTEPNAPDAAKLFEQYCVAPADAIIDPITYEVTPEVYGYGFDIAQIQKKLDAAKYGQTVSVELDFIMPQVTAKDLTENLFVDLLASYTCDNPSGSSEWLANMALCAEAINGVVIEAGADFSFNTTLGRPTTQKGYRQAAEYSNGKLTQVIGGGISQTASALYYCALMADLDILERAGNPYAVDYIGLGLDAYIDWGAQDLRLRNSTEAPIRITAEVEGSAVTIRLFGEDTRSYVAQIHTEVVGETLPDTINRVVDRNNVYGFTEGQIVQPGIIGYEVQTSMDKFDKQTGELVSSTLIDSSTYGKQDQIVIGIESDYVPPSEPTDPTDSTDSSTPSDPADPTVPSDSTDSTDSSAPTDPTNPIEDSAPTHE